MSQKILCFDPFSGISGDMAVAALLDICGPEGEKILRAQLSGLIHDQYKIEVSTVSKCGIGATDFAVHVHHHAHDCGHGHEHVHTGLSDILHLIEHSTLACGAKALAVKIFTVLAEAEAHVHTKSIEEIHFHEVGAVDSIVDICSVAVLLDHLQPDRIICLPVCEGRGFVKCEHGVMPVPVPATVELFSRRNAPLLITERPAELVTPTGAAIVCALAEFVSSPGLSLLKTGYGAGKKDFDTPNLLRVFIASEERTHAVTEMQTNIDNTTPEVLAYTMERLLAGGALDVWFEQIMMKKSRPAVKLCTLCKTEDTGALAEIILSETGTIGIRYNEKSRIEMTRENIQVHTDYGTVSAKKSVRGNLEKYSVEYEDARRLALEQNVPIRKVLGI